MTDAEKIIKIREYCESIKKELDNMFNLKDTRNFMNELIDFIDSLTDKTADTCKHSNLVNFNGFLYVDTECGVMRTLEFGDNECRYCHKTIKRIVE